MTPPHIVRAQLAQARTQALGRRITHQPQPAPLKVRAQLAQLAQNLTSSPSAADVRAAWDQLAQI